MKKILFGLLMLPGFAAPAQEPTGYYDNALGLSGQQMRVALHNIIDGHTSRTYSQLWDAYYDTDRKPSGKIWDMYSDVPGGTPPYEFSYGTDQCGNYNSEGDCYNREHSWPKSHFNQQMPTYTDLFIVFPTDGYVNGKRSNYPYGVVSSANWTSDNGSKLGVNTYTGSGGGLCFEPIDSFKGDLARSYFYTTTRYYGEDSGWENWEMANGAELKPWAIAMLLEWHHSDPVSQKEIDRNNAIYDIQHNRNPFIDHPEFVDCIWAGGSDCGTPVGVWAIDALSAGMRVYPNPAAGVLHIDMSKLQSTGDVQVSLVDMIGRTVFEENAAAGTTTDINTARLFKGMYILKVNTPKGAVHKQVQVL